VSGGIASVSKVVIAMPVYNGAAYLEEVLTSIKNQTFQDFRVYICDNASTDDTPIIAARFSADSKKFIYIRNELHVNALGSVIRAYQLTNKASQYFIFMHDDNVYSPSFLEKMVCYMDAHPECSLCGFFLHYVNQESGKITAKHHSSIPAILRRSKLLHFAFEWRSVINTFVLHCFMRRSAIDKIELDLEIDDFPERYYIAQLRGLGRFHIIEEDLVEFYSGGVGETSDDPWVKDRKLMKFGEKELKVLFSFNQINPLEKLVLAQQFAYVTLRHKVPETVRRWWLFPAYLAAYAADLVRPNKWTHEGGRPKKL
jgi:glycosyltransferase involved in cell wall biosynthesis